MPPLVLASGGGGRRAARVVRIRTGRWPPASGYTRRMDWEAVRKLDPIRLNLGGYGDCHPRPGYEGFVAVDLEARDGWTVGHDLMAPFPLVALVEASPFRTGDFHQYWSNGAFVDSRIDYSLGWVKRTKDNDPRNRRRGAAEQLGGFLRDVGHVVRSGFHVDRAGLATVRGRPFRMTSIVVDLEKLGPSELAGVSA